MFIYLCYNVVCILCEWYALPPNRMQWVVTHMLTKNPYVIVLFSAAALGMLAGVGFGLLWPDGAMVRYVLSPTAMAEADTLRQRLVLVGNVSIPVAKWMLFLFFCGFLRLLHPYDGALRRACFPARGDCLYVVARRTGDGALPFAFHAGYRCDHGFGLPILLLLDDFAGWAHLPLVLSGQRPALRNVLPLFLCGRLFFACANGAWLSYAELYLIKRSV